MPRQSTGPATTAEISPDADRGGARPRRTARERARAEVTSEILDAARTQLAEEGAASLSLRRIARDLGMASSAVYRYVPSRDELLTRLIVEAYDALGDAAERAQQGAENQGAAAQLRAVWHAVRDWAVAHPHEYALIYGSPVPGYRAPDSTVPSATRVANVLMGILIEDDCSSPLPLPDHAIRESGAALAPLRTQIPTDLVGDPELLVALTTWTILLGAISMELFGHIHNVVDESVEARRAYFDAQVDLAMAMLGM